MAPLVPILRAGRGTADAPERALDDGRQFSAETALFKKLSDKREGGLAVVLAVKSTLARRGIETPPAGGVRRVLDGLKHVDELCTTALLPTRKAPLTADMLVAMHALSVFTVRGLRVTWSSPVASSIRAMFLIMWRTGMRKDDAIRLRKAAAWIHPGGGYNLRPGALKTDPLSKTWGSDVVALPRPCGTGLHASSGLHSLPAALGTAPLCPGADD
jgi:hypothetical protein